MVASPNGQKIVYSIPVFLNYAKNFIVSFDASTGIISDEQILSSGGGVWGVSFSPDNSKLYCSTHLGEIYQYNLNTSSLNDIIASKMFIIQTGGSDLWRHHQLAPNGRIYLARINKPFLSCIEYPDELYPACNFIDSAIYIGGQYSSWGLPNFIAGYKYHNQLPCTDYIPPEELTIPNIFTPNNDGINDVFEIKNLPQKANVQIYNRWGALIFETSNPNNFWNGKTKTGSELNEGVYFYIITLPGNERKTGFVQLIR